MGRRIPSCSLEANNVHFFHPVIVVSFVVAWIIASIAIITSLCAYCHRKRASSKSPSKPPSPPSKDATAPAAAEAATVELVSEHLQAQSSPEEEEEEEETREIEWMPEAAAEHGPILPTVVLPSSTSKRKLSISLSTKLPQKIKSKRERRQGKAASEDSIWKKTIILGEKCKVPDDDDDDDDDEVVVVCDDEGNRQRVYHPRTPRSVPLSRNTSFANPSEVPS